MILLTIYDSYARFLLKAQRKLKKEDGPWAVVVMDLDQFKLVNDIFGRNEGDKVLQLISGLWREKLRPGELFARREADQFSALLKYTTDGELCGRMDDFCARLQTAGGRELGWTASRYFTLRPSIGICLAGECRDVDKMQSRAALARQLVKNRADRRYAFFDEQMAKDMAKMRSLEDQMELGLLREEFEVYYQPKFDLVTQKIVGAEALIRWQQPDGSFISPGEFIPLAEKDGLIGRLDRYMFRQVCRQQRRWLEAGIQLVPISVNLSRSLLYDRELPEEYAREAACNKIPTRAVQLEITEREAAWSLEVMVKAVKALKQAGFRILLDDFGCGYSSLEVLRALPVDVIKLDKSFIDAYNDERGRKILESMIQLSRNLGADIIAEGVETDEQAKFLKACGCYRIQGYYYSKPLPGEAFARLLEKRGQVRQEGCFAGRIEELQKD